MTHELKEIFLNFLAAREQGLKCVLATVTDLDGSSYRRPGVRMLIAENGKMKGAVSGGCVEKEVQRQAEQVFQTGNAIMMTYDGRYRLGCEGILYILIEPFDPEKIVTTLFSESLEVRNAFELVSHYSRHTGESKGIGSLLSFRKGKYHSVSQQPECEMPVKAENLLTFTQHLHPCFQLLIIGAEHDAVQLTRVAAFAGWEVTVICSEKDPKTTADFPGAKNVMPISDDLQSLNIDDETAIVLMTHNYAKDFSYLISLKESFTGYIGLLGSYDRREKIVSALIEKDPDIDMAFLDNIHGPAGLDIGAETPQEIALSIVSEILAFRRKTTPMKLREKSGRIHS